MTEVKEVNINVPKRAVVINEAPRASARGIFFFAYRAAFGDCSPLTGFRPWYSREE